MAATIKFSRQREAIKDYLFHTKEHPTADTIYINIREQYPNISLGTVYRNLSFLLDQGEIVKIDCGDGCDHFDGNTLPHNHFICRKCHKLTDIYIDTFDKINSLVNYDFDGDIDGNITYFYGVCGECKRKK